MSTEKVSSTHRILHEISEHKLFVIFSYDDMRHSKDSAQALLNFFESAFKGGAELANWDLENSYDFKTPAVVSRRGYQK